MNEAIKALEKVGQNTSMKQHDSLQEMLQGMNLQVKSFYKLNSQDIVCVHTDDNDDDD